MRLIDADALKYKQQVMYKKDGSDDVWAEWFTTATEINNAPTIDAVPVVRCKDCFLYDECKAAEWYGENGNGYCSVGDRRKDDE